MSGLGPRRRLPLPGLWQLALVAGLAAGALAGRGASADPGFGDSARSAAEILDAAFANRYEVDLTSKIELIVRNRAGQERRRLVQAVSKVIGDRVHSIGRLVAPDYLRGMTVMTIESQSRSHDAFLYLPSLDRVRRISTAQRGDAFFGTDITYEDLERRRSDDYTVGDAVPEDRGGEPVYLIEARPLRTFNYERIVFAVARRDGAILETHYFKRGAAEPYRLIRAPREAMIEAGGHVLPTRLLVENRTAGTTTEVLIGELVVDPEIDDHLFSITTLEARRPLPGES